MQSNRAKVGVGVLLVAAVVVLFVVLSGGDDDGSDNGQTTTADTTQADQPEQNKQDKPTVAPEPTVSIKGGEPVGGVQDLKFTGGEQVRFRVKSDTEGEVHVHGYDVEKEVAAGGSVSFDFPAALEGGYEVELHHGGGETVIAELQVQPG